VKLETMTTVVPDEITKTVFDVAAGKKKVFRSDGSIVISALTDEDRKRHASMQSAAEKSEREP